MVTRHDMEVLATQRRIASALDRLVESVKQLSKMLGEVIIELTKDEQHPGGMHTERHIHPPK